MSKAQPVPRKYKAFIEEAVIELRLVAEKAVAVRTALRADDYILHELQSDLRDIEVSCLSAALDLSVIDVANDCDTCPSATLSTLKYQAALAAIAQYLEQLSRYAQDASQ